MFYLSKKTVIALAILQIGVIFVIINTITNMKEEKTESHTAVHLQSQGEKPRNQEYYGEKHRYLVGQSQKCIPKTYIFYLKVHKAASSTSSALFNQYAWRHNLTIVPVQNPYYYTPHHPVMKNLIMTFPGENKTPIKYNVMANHVIFHMKDIESFMSNETVYIGSIREPLMQFKSALNEFIAAWISIKGPDTANTFLTKIKDGKLTQKEKKWSNMMMKEFGLDNFGNMTNIKRYIDLLDKRFEMIIAEHFDESMVMLRRKLCWKTIDIVYINKRNRNYISKSKVYSQNMTMSFKNFSSSDYLLYNHFLKRFQEQLALQSKDFYDELQYFQQIKASISVFCNDIFNRIKKDYQVIYKMAKNKEEIRIFNRTWEDNFTISAVDCAVMNLETPVLRNIIIVRQMPRICKTPHMKYQHASLLSEIRWTKKYSVIQINKLFCTSWDSYYDLPLAVLSNKGAYMF